MKILLLFLLLMSGCISNSVQQLDPAVYYRNDICFEYKTDELVKVRRKTIIGRTFGSPKYTNKTLEFCGVGVLPYKDLYEMKVIGYGKLNFFSLMTCHEEDTSENPDSGIMIKNGTIDIKYTPTLEKTLACPLYVSAYNKRQKHSWGIIAFEHPKFQLQATVECNGYTALFDGTSICQSRNGLLQKITFEEEVVAVRPVTGAAERLGDCPEVTSNDNKEFIIKLPSRECIYQFIGRESKKAHRLYSIGYEDIIVRE